MAKSEKTSDKAATVAAISAQLATSLATPEPTPASAATKTIASKAGWKGTLEFGGLVFPVGTYKATESESISFNQTHDSCGSRLKQGSMRCEHCAVEVAKENIRKGYAYESDKFVYVTPEELEACEPASNKVLTIVRFVPAASIDPIYFAGTEFVGPAGENAKGKTEAARGYALLLDGMVATSTVALAKRSTRGREQWVVLRPFNTKTLVASDLLFGNEVRAFEKTDSLPVANPAEVELASQLIQAMTEEFNEFSQSDEYNVNVRRLLDSKIYGQDAPVVTKRAAQPESGDLMSVLQASLATAKSKKVAA